ncbi:bifunctional riboflavin kinase/FAD synthetase [Winogradskyella aurantiaca]|uniref:bifunctional riboflavin kinase/FAD synthetase n=1 Tax=Winogradskyella aurantiaca TaxID=2219558 RepID=UPI000E1DE8F8|nr:bifunctional riboflavin kinase/FAD synthetase [Winogradskyella aurantiaca]
MNLNTGTTDTKNNATIITIGTFDGVHIGHQKILKDIVSIGKASGLRSTVLTLFPHPRMVLQKDDSIKLLNTIDERIDIIKSLGIDHVEVKEFTKEFSNMTARDYVTKILINELHAKEVVIGYDHHFGKNREGNINDLIVFGQEFGFSVKEIKAQQIADVSVSSTKIRKALLNGDVETANLYLGYPYSIKGDVIKGDKIGRTINYPTANLNINASYKLIPKDGVYVVNAIIDGVVIYGMMNIGFNPTIRGKRRSIEVHFFDFNNELYGRSIKVSFMTRLRDEMKFSSIESLKAQLKLDEVASRNYINGQS